MTKLTRKSVSAIAKLETSGLSHTKRLDAIARILGLSDATTMMATLKKEESATKAAPAKTDVGPDAPHQYFMALQEPHTSGYLFDSFATEAELNVWSKVHEEIFPKAQVLIDCNEKPSPLFNAERRMNPSLTFGAWFETSDCLYVLVTGTPTDADDIEDVIPGAYAIILDSHSLTSSTTSIARAALDTFHDNVGIACLDDFEITICTSSGLHLFEEDEDDEDDAYVTYEGLQSLEDVPQAVLKAFKEQADKN